MLKYGKVALVDGLSGSSGQVAAPHGPRPDAVIPVDGLELSDPDPGRPRPSPTLGVDTAGRRRATHDDGRDRRPR